jgi:DDE superfamily endonuclease
MSFDHHFKWKRASMAAGLCYGSRGGGAQLAFHHQPGAYDTDTLIQALGELRRFLGGEKATLVWDGLPAHRSHAMRAWLRRQRSWLVVEPLPAYAPELNPVEPLWSNLKGVELANLAGFLRSCPAAEILRFVIGAASSQVGRSADRADQCATRPDDPPDQQRPEHHDHGGARVVGHPLSDPRRQPKRGTQQQQHAHAAHNPRHDRHHADAPGQR